MPWSFLRTRMGISNILVTKDVGEILVHRVFVTDDLKKQKLTGIAIGNCAPDLAKVTEEEVYRNRRQTYHGHQGLDCKCAQVLDLRCLLTGTATSRNLAASECHACFISSAANRPTTIQG